MKIIALLLITGCLLLARTVHAEAEDSDDIQDAVKALQAYTDDVKSAEYEQNYIAAVERDIYALADSNSPISLRDREKQCNKDFAALHAWDEFIQKHGII